MTLRTKLGATALLPPLVGLMLSCALWLTSQQTAQLANTEHLTARRPQTVVTPQGWTPRLTLILSGSILGMTALVSWRIGSRIVKSLHDLRESANNIAAADLDHRVAIPTHDEMGQLAQAFNRMTERLHTSYTALQEEIAERRRAEKTWQQREAQLRFIIDNVPVIIAYCDREDRYQFVNNTFAR